MIRKIIACLYFWAVAAVPLELGRLMDADDIAILVAALAYGYFVMPGLIMPIWKWANRDG